MPMLFMRTVSGFFSLCIGCYVHVLCAFLGHSESGGVSKAGQLCHDHSSQAPWQAGLKVGGGACSHVASAFGLGLWLQCYFTLFCIQVWKQPKVWQGFIKCCEVSYIC